jgi:ABC-2 type transport system permease protein
MFGFLVLTSVTFCLFGFVLGIWATGWENLQIVPILVITPMTFLGGSFYSIDMLPPFWQQVTLLNPVVYLINGFRFCFFGFSDVSVVLSVGMTVVFMALCLGIVWWVFRTGHRLKS